jgi:hypothetical protein
MISHSTALQVSILSVISTRDPWHNPFNSSQQHVVRLAGCDEIACASFPEPEHAGEWGDYLSTVSKHHPDAIYLLTEDTPDFIPADQWR